jgi:hypothetical protein
MKTKLFISLLVVLLLIPSCEKIPIGESFIAKVGDKIHVTSSFSFSVQRVLDYRCPVDMECVSSGDVNTYIRFHQPFHQTDTVICLLSSGKNPIDIHGYSFKILSVSPLPKQDVSVSQNDFRIEMIINDI